MKKITGQKYRKSFFIIELPEYKLPSLKRACGSMLERGKAYIVKAGTIILVCNTIVQIMQSFNWQFRLVEEGAEGTSILASIAHPFAILFIPLGFGEMCIRDRAYLDRLCSCTVVRPRKAHFEKLVQKKFWTYPDESLCDFRPYVLLKSCVE